jgi:hypothetical protein
LAEHFHAETRKLRKREGRERKRGREREEKRERER